MRPPESSRQDFDFRHVGRFWDRREIGARFDPRLAALERIGLEPPSALA